MRILIIKMSSMGDVVHTLPALTDAGNAIKDITFDWVVEESFQEIPQWHPLVKNIIPVALRRWRKNLFTKETRQEFKTFLNKLRENKYDLIIDAQGLLKSAFIALLAKGERAGGDFNSAREHLASIFYQRKVSVSRQQHAVVRMRSVFAQALGYAIPASIPDYGVDRAKFQNANEKYLVFLHGTTWSTKHWPEEYWIQLAKIAASKGFKIKLPWGNAAEQERAKRIASACGTAEVLPKLNLKEVAIVLASAQAIVSVDTGLGHLAAALDVPTVSLYGPTNPDLTGALGRSQKHLRVNFSCAPCLSRVCHYRIDKASAENQFLYPVDPPCFATLPPELVWSEVEGLL